MEQSRGGSPLKISITHTIYVTTRIRTTEEGTMPSCIATVLAPPSSSGTNQYRFVRLSNAGDGSILEILDTKIGTINEVPSIEKLNDGSWEMVVLQSYCPTLQAILGKIFPGSDVDLHYDPTEPTVSEAENFGYKVAKTICRYLFINRAERMVKEGWPMAADCYEHLAACINGRCWAKSRL